MKTNVLHIIKYIRYYIILNLLILLKIKNLNKLKKCIFKKRHTLLKIIINMKKRVDN